MSDIQIRKEGRAGRITLTRPKALNALSYAMCLAVDAALRDWRDDPEVALVILDADGDKAFCAGGDIAEMYATGTAGDYEYGRRFWRDEYRMNARIAEYPKPVVSFLQGFTMGGGVGLGGHCSHRIVGETSKISMPECSIGLVPDVGGSYLLARAPGRLGTYLGLTTHRMGPGDAIHAGFADHYLPEPGWEALKAALTRTGEAGRIGDLAHPRPVSPLAAAQPEIDRLFAADRLEAVQAALAAEDTDLARDAAKAMGRNAPLSMAVALAMLADLRSGGTIREALALEYRVSHRIMEHGDFLEGIRAAIIDRDRNPHWRFAGQPVPEDAVTAMLAPLGAAELTFREDDT